MQEQEKVKHQKVFEFEKATVIVEYTKIPGKAELEDICRRFLINVMKSREEKERRGNTGT